MHRYVMDVASRDTISRETIQFFVGECRFFALPADAVVRKNGISPLGTTSRPRPHGFGPVLRNDSLSLSHRAISGF
jgi:hypothetical protein